MAKPYDMSTTTPDASRAGTPQRPHIVTVVISVLALLVSVAGFIYAYRSFQLSKAVSISAIEINDFELLADWQWKPVDTPKENPIAVKYTLENLGKLPAQRVSLHLTATAVFESTLRDPSTGNAAKGTAGDWALPNFLTQDLPPGGKQDFQLEIRTDGISGILSRVPNFSGKIDGLNFMLEFAYSDEYGDHHAVECFYIPSHEDSVIKHGKISRCNTTGRTTFSGKITQLP